MEGSLPAAEGMKEGRKEVRKEGRKEWVGFREVKAK